MIVMGTCPKVFAVKTRTEAKTTALVACEKDDRKNPSLYQIQRGTPVLLNPAIQMKRAEKTIITLQSILRRRKYETKRLIDVSMKIMNKAPASGIKPRK